MRVKQGRGGGRGAFRYGYNTCRFFFLVATVSFLVYDPPSFLICHQQQPSHDDGIDSNNADAINRLSNLEIPPQIVVEKRNKTDVLVGANGGAWTAGTHLSAYGFNVDAGLVRMLEASCREIENQRNSAAGGDGSQWSKHPSQTSPIGGLWRPPSVVDCRVLELGPGVGVYVDSLKKDSAKRKRLVFGVEPNPMGGVFDRRNGPRQLAIDILEHDDPVALAHSIRKEHLGGDKAFDLLYSIEVCEHMPLARHEDAARFLAGLAREGTKLLFGAAKPGQEGTGHIGNRPMKEWENILANVGFVKNYNETLALAHELDEYNHKINTQVYYYHFNNSEKVER